MIPLIVELELWSPPQSGRAPHDGKEIAARCRRETGLSPDAVLGLNFVADAQDVEELRSALALSRVGLEEFNRFCEKHALPADPNNKQSAAEFLASVQGQPLAWLHLPADPTGLDMAHVLTRWARENNLQIRDGAGTYEPLSAKQVCALWQSAA